MTEKIDIKTATPLVTIRMKSKQLDELRECEYGSYEDHIHDGDVRDEPYDDGTLHIVELIDRSPFKTVVHLYAQDEIDEFFGQACTGTFGLHYPSSCFDVYDKLIPFVSEKARWAVNRSFIGF